MGSGSRIIKINFNGRILECYVDYNRNSRLGMLTFEVYAIHENNRDVMSDVEMYRHKIDKLIQTQLQQ